MSMKKEEKRQRTTLYFKTSFKKKAKTHCKKTKVSMSRWLEELAEAALKGC